MLKYPQINPVIFEIGPIAPRWYGLMWLCGFIFTYTRLKKHSAWLGFKKIEDVDSALGMLVLGTILGARIAYVLFYNLSDTLAGPWWEFIAVWHGGLAFHGGLVGMLVAAWLVTKKYKIEWLKLCDVVGTAAPVGLGLGRIANFINGELWGRESDLPWAMIFPGAGPNPRHPSQIYQFLLEGVLLYLIVNFVWKRKPSIGITGGTFLTAYAIMRITVEFFREPDAQVGFLFNFLTMGQLLSFAMLCGGIITLLYTKKRAAPWETNAKR